MLKKLLKVEWMSSGRALLIMDLGVLGICLLASAVMAMSVFWPSLSSQTWITVLVALSLFSAVVGILVMLFGTVLINVRSFYNLLGQRGYLMLTLPVTTHQHIAAKLFYAVISSLASFVFLAVEVCLLAAATGENLIASFLREFPLEAEFAGLIFYLILFVLLSTALNYLFFYLCVAIGGQWPQQRLLASILSFFVLQFLVQLLGTILLVFAAFGIYAVGGTDWLNVTFEQFLQQSGPFGLLYGVLTLFLVLSVAVGALLWFIIHFFMTKKLNLA